MKFKVLTWCGLDDDVKIWDLEAKNSEVAWDVIEDGGHSYESNILLNKKRWDNLVKEVKKHEDKRRKG